MDKKQVFLAALIGGIVMTIMTHVPYLNYLNYVLCAGIILGGFVGGWYYSKKNALSPKDGAIIGLYSGLMGGLLMSIMGIIIAVTTASPLTQLLGLLGLGTVATTTIIVLSIISTIMYFVLGIGFGTLGGLIAGAVFQKK